MLTPTLVSDSQISALLEQIAAGDHDAMHQFHDLVKPRVLRGLRRILRDPYQVEEAAQDVFRHIWVKAASFDSSRTPPFAWLSVIIRSRAIDSLRASSRQRSYQPTDWWEAQLVSNFETPEQSYSRRVCNTRLHSLVSDLRSEQREFVVLAFYEGLSHDEIARTTGTPLGTVKTRIRAALAVLRAGIARLGLNRQEWLPALDGDDLLLL